MGHEPSMSRRDVVWFGAAFALGSVVPFAAHADEVAGADALAAAESAQYKAALGALLRGREAALERVKVDIPESNENGNIVPYKLAVESPMTEEEMIRSLTLLSTGNPQPLVATFHFTSFSGRAAVSGRMRLAKSQTVVAVAETGTGALLMGKTFVQVTVGGCGND